MAVPYDPKFNKNKNKTSKTFLCGICTQPFPDLGQMLAHEDVCSGEFTPPEEGEEQIPSESKDTKPQVNKPIIPFKPKLPYGYGQK